jgi:hypothetical protein
MEMKNKKEWIKKVHDLQDQIKGLVESIQMLEKQASDPDFTDPIRAIGTLETIQANLTAKRSVLEICQEQLKLAQIELDKVEQAERYAKIASLRLDERKRLLDFLKELNMLQNVYGQLEAVGNEIAINRGHRDIIPNLKTMMATVNAFQRNLNGLRPELFGDKPKQSRQERMIQSAKLNVERQKALVNDFKSQKDQSFKFNPKTQQFDQHAMVDGEDLERAKVRLHQAEDQLDLLQGTLEEKRREQQKAADEKAKEERLEFAQSRVAWKERIKARQQEQGVKP